MVGVGGMVSKIEKSVERVRRRFGVEIGALWFLS